MNEKLTLHVCVDILILTAWHSKSSSAFDWKYKLNINVKLLLFTNKYKI